MGDVRLSGKANWCTDSYTPLNRNGYLEVRTRSHPPDYRLRTLLHHPRVGILMTMIRPIRHIVQETYLTYSYSPMFLEDGTVGGIYATVNETTSRVIRERQLRFACSLPCFRA
jgi:hypothetical protein